MYRIEHTDCFDWLRSCPPQTIQAICTDPPYGLIEFSEKELSKLRNGRGGVWRLPPTIGGHKRDPLPRFTALTDEEKLSLRVFSPWTNRSRKSSPAGALPNVKNPISDHPCLKPQHFMRIIVRALLPLGEGTVLDPFMGSGSTIAAAEAVGYRSVGIEIDKDYFHLAEASIPKLAALYPTFEGDTLEFDSSDYPQEAVEEAQLTMALAESAGRYRVRKS